MATEPLIGGQDFSCRAGSWGPPGASYGGGGGGGYDLLLFGVSTLAGRPPTQGTPNFDCDGIIETGGDDDLGDDGL